MAFNESIGGVWVKTDKNGNKYLSIQIDKQGYKAFKNKYKTEEKHPDFRVVKNEPKEPLNEPRPSFIDDDTL
jgi:uncharacterized protein (DUF736 family)